MSKKPARLINSQALSDLVRNPKLLTVSYPAHRGGERRPCLTFVSLPSRAHTRAEPRSYHVSVARQAHGWPQCHVPLPPSWTRAVNNGLPDGDETDWGLPSA
jgi:hypothetical protein